MNENENFIISFLLSSSNILFSSMLSGLCFEFVPLTGKILSDHSLIDKTSMIF